MVLLNSAKEVMKVNSKLKTNEKSYDENLTTVSSFEDSGNFSSDSYLAEDNQFTLFLEALGLEKSVKDAHPPQETSCKLETKIFREILENQYSEKAQQAANRAIIKEIFGKKKPAKKLKKVRPVAVAKVTPTPSRVLLKNFFQTFQIPITSDFGKKLVFEHDKFSQQEIAKSSRQYEVYCKTKQRPKERNKGLFASNEDNFTIVTADRNILHDAQCHQYSFNRRQRLEKQTKLIQGILATSILKKHQSVRHTSQDVALRKRVRFAGTSSLDKKTKSIPKKRWRFMRKENISAVVPVVKILDWSPLFKQNS